MKCEIFLTVFIITVSAKADFSDRVRSTNVKLFENVASDTKDNFVISPFSVWSLMTSLSSEAGGESRRQIKRALYLPRETERVKDGFLNLTKTVLEPSEDVKLVMKNFLFIDKDIEIKKRFLKKINKSNSSNTIAKFLDFSSDQTALEANNIINEYTNLSKVLSEKDFENSKMILTNVISFKGLWSSPFNETETTVEPFYDEYGNEIGHVNMMYQRYPFSYSLMDEMNAKVLELPYGNDKRFCMLILLPYHSVSVRVVYESFSKVSFRDIFAKLKSDEEEFDLNDVDVKIPRFKINTTFLLKKHFKSVGVHNIFEPNLANFTMTTNKELYISSIIHKAEIEVTESGTVASASSTSFFSDRISTPNFIVNKPFIYLIMEKPTATVLFNGIYSQPTQF